MTSANAGRTATRIVRAATGLEFVLACALIAAVGMNVVNVIGRYVFGSSMSGVDEIQI